MVNTTGLPFNVAGGPRVDAIYHSNSKEEIELSGFLIDGFHARDAEFGDVTFPGTGFSVPSTTGIEFDYASRLYSAEINFRRPVRDNVTLMLGVRWVELDESLTGVNEPSTIIGTVTTVNHMYGLQAGADVTLWAPSADSPFRIDGVAKGGIYYDRGSENTSFPGFGGSTGATGDHPAFLGEASVIACYQLSKHACARIGAQADWLQSVALATNQLMTNNVVTGSAACDMSGGLFLFGGFAGVEIDY
jgi:hypothetical protein